MTYYYRVRLGLYHLRNDSEQAAIGRKWDIGILIGLGVVGSLWASFLATLAGGGF
jgi:hypothetical protein